MKKISFCLYSVLLVTYMVTGCKKKLIEEPRSVLTPGFFLPRRDFSRDLMRPMRARDCSGATRIILPSR